MVRRAVGRVLRRRFSGGGPLFPFPQGIHRLTAIAMLLYGSKYEVRGSCCVIVAHLVR